MAPRKTFPKFTCDETLFYPLNEMTVDLNDLQEHEFNETSEKSIVPSLEIQRPLLD
jgi:hypothetical protein